MGCCCVYACVTVQSDKRHNVLVWAWFKMSYGVFVVTDMLECACSCVRTCECVCVFSMRTCMQMRVCLLCVRVWECVCVCVCVSAVNMQECIYM
jgi:hypothetical protein